MISLISVAAYGFVRIPANPYYRKFATMGSVNYPLDTTAFTNGSISCRRAMVSLPPRPPRIVSAQPVLVEGHEEDHAVIGKGFDLVLELGHRVVLEECDIRPAAESGEGLFDILFICCSGRGAVVDDVDMLYRGLDAGSCFQGIFHVILLNNTRDIGLACQHIIRIIVHSTKDDRCFWEEFLPVLFL